MSHLHNYPDLKHGWLINRLEDAKGFYNKYYVDNININLINNIINNNIKKGIIFIVLQIGMLKYL